MSICNICGGSILFRNVDGQVTPIHINGSGCAGAQPANTTKSLQLYKTIVSYTNPNAYCPVCGEKVFFYRSPSGGRVFFDDLGWPWPKHGCTDTSQSEVGKLPKTNKIRHVPFIAKNGDSLSIYTLVNISSAAGVLSIKLGRIENVHIILNLSVENIYLRKRRISLKDMNSAPSFIVRTLIDYREVEFICGRTGSIKKIRVDRM